MTLYEKIVSIYPELGLTQDVNGRDIPNEAFINLTIMLQNDSDGRGDYIKEWNHPTLARPTDEQLEGVQ